MLANTPRPPYYAVIFSSYMSNNNDGYAEMAVKMLELAKLQDGYLGIESAREEIGITVSYWKDLESIKNWKHNVDHEVARKNGRTRWYSDFRVRVSLVERDYSL